MTIKSKLFLFVLFPVFAIFALIKFYDFELGQTRSELEIQAGMRQEAQNYANRVDALLSQAGAIALTTARFLSVTEISNAAVIYEVLRRNVEANPFVYGSAVAFEPFAFERRPLFSPYVHRVGSEFKSIDIGADSYDYTQPEWEWYARPKELTMPVWTEPYFDEGAGGIFMVTLSAPFFIKGAFAGVATVDLDLRKLLEQSGIDESARTNSFVLSPAGTLVFHHVVSRLGKPLNNQQLLAALGDGSPGFVELAGAEGETQWLAHAPVPTSDWDFVVERSSSSALVAIYAEERRVILLFAAAMLFGAIVALIFVRRIVNPVTRLVKAAERVSGGNLSVQIAPESSDEVGRLAKAFSVMTSRLARREEELVSMNETLEERVTERTAEVHMSEERLEGAAAGAKLGLWDVTPQTGEIFVNEIFESQLGYPRLGLRETDAKWSRLRFMLGDWPEHIHPDDRQRVIDAIGRHLRGETAVYMSEHRVRCADGSYKWILATGMPMARDSAGLPVRVTGVHIDIGPMKGLQAQLELARDAAEAAGQAKADFLANMSHEIRTPMNAIIGMGNLIMKTDLTPKQRGHLEKIQSSSRLLLGIINDILDFSKVEAGRVDIEAIPFNLGDVLDGASNMITLQAEKKVLDILIAVEKDVPHRLIGDPLRIGQILSNLCSNAIKFTEKGEIRISVRTVEQTADNVRLQFSVTDSGIGLKEEHREKIFEAFSQADSSITRRYGGTGLGLPICRRLAGLMGGTIWVESEHGKGSTFSFTVLLRAAAPDTDIELESKALSIEIALDSSKRILIVEDHPINQEVLLGYLEELGLSADVASNGREALNLHDRQRYDLILSDVHMPEMDGIEMVAELRRREKDSNVRTRVVAVSASARPEEIEHNLKAGFDDCIQKPIEPDVLADLLRRIIGRN